MDLYAIISNFVSSDNSAILESKRAIEEKIQNQPFILLQQITEILINKQIQNSFLEAILIIITYIFRISNINVYKEYYNIWNSPENEKLSSDFDEIILQLLTSQDKIINNLSCQIAASIYTFEFFKPENFITYFIKKLSTPPYSKHDLVIISNIVEEFLELSPSIISSVFSSNPEIKTLFITIFTLLIGYLREAPITDLNTEIPIRKIVISTLNSLISNFLSDLSHINIFRENMEVRINIFNEILQCLINSISIPDKSLFSLIHDVYSNLYTKVYSIGTSKDNINFLINILTRNSMNMPFEYICPILSLWCDIAQFEYRLHLQKIGEKNLKKNQTTHLLEVDFIDPELVGILSKKFIDIYLENLFNIISCFDPNDQTPENPDILTPSIQATITLKYLFRISPERISEAIEDKLQICFSEGKPWMARQCGLLFLMIIAQKEEFTTKQTSIITDYFQYIFQYAHDSSNQRIMDTAIYDLGISISRNPEILITNNFKYNSERIMTLFTLFSPQQPLPPLKLLQRYCYMLLKVIEILKTKTTLVSPLNVIFPSIFNHLVQFTNIPQVSQDSQTLSLFYYIIANLVIALPGTPQDYMVIIEKVFLFAMQLMNAPKVDDPVIFTRLASACSILSSILIKIGKNIPKVNLDQIFSVLIEILKNQNSILYREALNTLSKAVEVSNPLNDDQMMILNQITLVAIQSGSPEITKVASILVQKLCEYQRLPSRFSIELMQKLDELFKFFSVNAYSCLPGIFNAMKWLFCNELQSDDININVLENHFEIFWNNLKYLQDKLENFEDYDDQTDAINFICKAYGEVGFLIFKKDEIKFDVLHYLQSLKEFTQKLLNMDPDYPRFCMSYADCFVNLVKVVPPKINTKLITGFYQKFMNLLIVCCPKNSEDLRMKLKFTKTTAPNSDDK